MSDDESETQMAALMGFSTFGASKSKKRKFNSATDAFVDGQELEKLDRGGKKGKGSGGNSAPLGKRRVLGEKSGGESVVRTNADELDLGDGSEGEDMGDGGVPILTNLPPPMGRISPPRELEEEDEEEGPNYVDTSMPPPLLADSRPNPDPAPQTEEERMMQEKIDSILDAIKPPPSSTVEPPSFSPPRNRNTGFAPMAHQHHDLPARPNPSPLPNPPHLSYPPPNPNAGAPGVGRGGFAGGRAGRGGGANHGGRERNEKWWEGYYDPSFNENPWGLLEKEQGLESTGGSWLERGHWDRVRGERVS